MKPRYRLLLVLLPILAGAAVWFARPGSEPAYQGKPLSQWIAEIKAGDPNHPSDFSPIKTQHDAIQAMGLKALPALLEAVHSRSDEPWWPRTYRNWYNRLSFSMRQHFPAPAAIFNRDSFFQDLVIEDARNLRPQSEPLLVTALRHSRPSVRATAAQALNSPNKTSPEMFSALTNRVRDPNVEVRLWVVAAIAGYGPAASNAVPAIVENIRDGRPAASSGFRVEERAWAAMGLGYIGSGALTAVPVLQEGAAQRTNAFFRVMSAIALWRIRHQPADALPALLQELATFDPVMKWEILDCFGEMGAGATSAVPKIVAFLDAPRVLGGPDESYNRQVALESLRKIAPEVAAKREQKAAPPKP